MSRMPALPRSAVPGVEGLIGLAGLFAAWLFVAISKPKPLIGGALFLVSAGVPMLIFELRRKRGDLVAPESIWPQSLWSKSARLIYLKAFFIPLYALSLFGLAGATTLVEPNGIAGLVAAAVIFAYVVDVGFALSGYVFTSSNLPNRFRSIQSDLLGWIVCLVCYPTLGGYWPAFDRVVAQQIGWIGHPQQNAAYVAATCLLLAILVLYVSATVAFGLRFANLSNRGIITSGPYRLMKHPAYTAHVANAWIIVFVVFPASATAITPELAVVPVAFTILYRLRAITEERHLQHDPHYVAYSHWIARNGLLARVKRLAHKTGRSDRESKCPRSSQRTISGS